MATYDPTKRYSWSPEDKFELSGKDFGLILNTLRSILSTEQAGIILMADKANSVIENIMAENVKSGVIKEAEVIPKTE